MRTALLHSASQSESKTTGRQQQLNRTLSKTKAVLQSFLKKGEKSFVNVSTLAQATAVIVGVDPSLYRKKSTPQKELFDRYAVRLCKKLPKSLANAVVPEEALRLQLSEATHRITVLEKILGDLSDRVTPSAQPAIKNETYFYEFETTCKLMEKVLLENQYLFFEGGKLMTRATMTAIPAELSDVNICKPFLDWRHARTTDIKSLSTTELEQSLRPTASRRADRPD